MKADTVSGPSVFANGKTATNMPFFDGKTLLFCQSTAPMETTIQNRGNIWNRMRRDKVLAEKLKKLSRNQQVIYRAWKLAYCDWDDRIVRTITTGLPANIAERSPAFFREGNRVHLSFIAGGPTSIGFHYRLYTCSGPDLEHLEPPQPLDKPPLFFGFVSPLYICWGAGNAVHMIEKASGSALTLQTSFYRIASVSFLADDPSKFLITGLLNKMHECQTILYDMKTGNVSDVSVGGPVYKSSMHGEHVVFAQKQPDGFEARELYHGDCTFSPSIIKISKGE